MRLRWASLILSFLYQYSVPSLIPLLVCRLTGLAVQCIWENNRWPPRPHMHVRPYLHVDARNPVSTNHIRRCGSRLSKLDWLPRGGGRTYEYRELAFGLENSVMGVQG